MIKMPVLEDLSRQKAALLKRKSALLKQLEQCMACLLYTSRCV